MPLTLGTSLVAQLMAIAHRHGAEVWLESPLSELVVDGGRVTGVVVQRGGEPVHVEAARGVVLAAGGFARNAELRQSTRVSAASGAQRWEPTRAMRSSRRRRSERRPRSMDDAWWGASFLTERGCGCVLPRGTVAPGLAHRRRRREAVRQRVGVLRGLSGTHSSSSGTVPVWLVLDSRHRKHYLFMQMYPGRTPQSAIDEPASLSRRARSRSWLRRRDRRDRPARTVERFNGFAATGVDEDFGRGHTAYDNYYGDPRVKPNPNLAPDREGARSTRSRSCPATSAPRAACVTDERARVLREDGTVIDGLYAAGNTSASVMGRTYPGPGATIGPAVVFGYLAARDLAAAPA